MYVTDIIINIFIVLAVSITIKTNHDNLEKQKRLAKIRYDEYNISQIPECSKYINEMRSTVGVNRYAMIVAALVAGIMYIALILIKCIDEDTLSFNLIYIIIFLTALASWGASYKLIYCLLSRNICGESFCR